MIMGTKIKDAALLESVTGAESIPVSDGTGTPKRVQFNTLKTLFSGGGGIPIVDSEEKLETLNLPQGSLASVAYDTTHTVSFRELYQPVADEDYDMSTGEILNPEPVSRVTKVKFTAPTGLQNVTPPSMLYLLDRTNPAFGAVLQFEIANGNVSGVGGMIAYGESYKNGYFVTYDENGVPSLNQEMIDVLNEVLESNDIVYLGNPMSGTITESEFDALDLFMMPMSGEVGTELYQKEPESWIKFPRKDLLPMVTSIKDVVSPLPSKVSTLESDVKRLTTRVTTLEGEDNYPYSSMSNISSETISPNIYNKRTPSANGMTIYFATPSKTNIVNEYVLEVVCNGASVTLPADLIWVNGVSPTFDDGTTVVVSVINKLAMFAVFETI